MHDGSSLDDLRYVAKQGLQQVYPQYGQTAARVALILPTQRAHVLMTLFYIAKNELQFDCADST